MTKIVYSSGKIFFNHSVSFSAATGAINYTLIQRVKQRPLIRGNCRITATIGIEKQVIRSGTGPKPVPGQNVTVHCTGFGKNGDLSQKFWSTKDPGQEPFKFQIGKGSVIKGWDEGVLGMQIGEVARLRCSPDYAYGVGGFPVWGIKPNSILDFEIEVLSVENQTPFSILRSKFLVWGDKFMGG